MDVETLNHLEPTSKFKDHSEYEKIRKRMKHGLMTTYLWNGRIYYDTRENLTSFKCGRRSKISENDRKPIVYVDTWLKDYLKR